MFMRIGRMVCALLPVLAASTAIAANGDLDPSFGTGGFRIAGILDGSANVSAGTAVQPDGKILLCETENTSGALDFFVARFTASGAIDTSFSFDGHTTIDFGGNNDICTGLAVQTDGKIVVAGTTIPTAAGSNADFAIARLNNDGTLDTSFGAGSGKAVVGFDLGGGNNDLAYALALRPDNRIVVVGSAQTAANGTDFAILQLNTDGSRDTSFNLTGRLSVGFDFTASPTKNDEAYRVAIDNQGRTVVAGAADRGPGPAFSADFAVVRILPNGQLDPNFSADGRATIAFDLGGAGGSNDDAAFGLAIDRAGNIVLTGYADSSASSTANIDMAIARLLPDGSPDATFGIGGKTTLAFDLIPNGVDYAIAVMEQSNRKLVIAGTSAAGGASNQVATATRLNANGSPDPGFGALGKKTYDFGQSSPSAQLFNGVVMQGSQIVFGGALNTVDTSHIDFVVARILDDLIFADGFD